MSKETSSLQSKYPNYLSPEFPIQLLSYCTTMESEIKEKLHQLRKLQTYTYYWFSMLLLHRHTRMFVAYCFYYIFVIRPTCYSGIS